MDNKGETRMTRIDFDKVLHDAKCWKLLMEKVEDKCQYSGTKSMLLPVLDLIREVKKEVGE